MYGFYKQLQIYYFLGQCSSTCCDTACNIAGVNTHLEVLLQMTGGSRSISPATTDLYKYDFGFALLSLSLCYYDDDGGDNFTRVLK